MKMDSGTPERGASPPLPFLKGGRGGAKVPFYKVYFIYVYMWTEPYHLSIVNHLLSTICSEIVTTAYRISWFTDLRVYVDHFINIIHKTKFALAVCIAPLCPTFVPAFLKMVTTSGSSVCSNIYLYHFLYDKLLLNSLYYDRFKCYTHLHAIQFHNVSMRIRYRVNKL